MPDSRFRALRTPLAQAFRVCRCSVEGIHEHKSTRSAWNPALMATQPPMTQIHPFRGVTYETPLAGPIENLITPPYDVISEEEREHFAAQSEYNVIRLILPTHQSGPDFYGHSKRCFENWLKDGVLAHEAQPALYLLRDRYVDDAGTSRERFGFFARIEIEDFAKGVVIPHEQTLEKPFRDRLRLLETTRTQASPIFFVYKDPDRIVSEQIAESVLSTPPRFHFSDREGIDRTLWTLSDSETIQRVRSLMNRLPVIIADGHHRYRTAAAYLAQTGHNSRKTALGFFSNVAQSDFPIRPIHRAVPLSSTLTFSAMLERLKGHFHSSRVAQTDFESLCKAAQEGQSLVVCHSDLSEACLLKPSRERDPRVATVILNEAVLKSVFELSEDAIRSGAISYFHSASGFERLTDNPAPTALFVLPPPRYEQILETCKQGSVLPQKSTFFYPKLPAGLVMNQLDPESVEKRRPS